MSPADPAPRAASSEPMSPDAHPRLPCVRLRSAVRHPLVYRKRILRVDPGVRPGDLVEVRDRDEQIVGFGLFNPKAELSLRMLTFGPDRPDDAFWDRTLSRAAALRREVLRLDETTDAYRVVHAEADGLSGLVADKLGDVLSVETYAAGMHRHAPGPLRRLAESVGAKHLLIRGGPLSDVQEGYAFDEIRSPGLPRETTIVEHGTRFRVRFDEAHKTGFFCDQRDNRRLLAQWCRGRSVLDLCCYTGGFAVQAKRLGGADEVVGVDLDEAPLKLARENANLNQVRVRFVQADAFPFLRDMQRNGRRFDVVVLDPPKLIRDRDEIAEGTRKHFDLNRLALSVVRPGGLLLTCSCAGLLPEEEFLRLVFSAARQTPVVPESGAADGSSSANDAAATDDTGSALRIGREVQVLARTGAAPDHPVSPSCPETEYLKAVWLRVM